MELEELCGESEHNGELAMVTSPSIMALANNTDHSRYIPEPIIDDILIRLPVRDLLRSKSVCKCWYSLISSPRFVSSHLDRTISDPSKHFILVRFNDEPEPPVSRNTANPVVRCIPRTNMEGVILVGSINGLVCTVDGDNDKVYDIWIWNPATGKLKKLPLCCFNAFLRVTFGFGWDPEDNVYKLAKLAYGHDSGSCCEVWCSDSDSWREIDVNNEISLCPGHATSSSDVTVKGGLESYWIVCNTLAYHERVVGFSDLQLAVASFDMSTEVLQITPFPGLYVSFEQLENDLSSCNVFGINWRENFGLVKRNSWGIQERYKVWTLNDADGVWTTELDLGFNPSPVGCLDSSNEKLVLVVAQRLILLDMKTRAFQDLGLAKDCVGEARFYLESLVSLEGFVPCPEE